MKKIKKKKKKIVSEKYVLNMDRGINRYYEISAYIFLLWFFVVVFYYLFYMVRCIGERGMGLVKFWSEQQRPHDPHSLGPIVA